VSFFDVGACPGALWSSNGGGGKGSMFDFLGSFPEGIIGSGSGKLKVGCEFVIT
jgi:hypothetical protein